jgi:hypothetical protein
MAELMFNSLTSSTSALEYGINLTHRIKFKVLDSINLEMSLLLTDKEQLLLAITEQLKFLPMFRTLKSPQVEESMLFHKLKINQQMLSLNPLTIQVYHLTFSKCTLVKFIHKSV